MTGFAKFLVGTAATSLLAFGAHSMTGTDYIDGLEEQGRSALSGEEFAGVKLDMARDPLGRTAILSGVDGEEARAAAEAAVLATPGISAVRWADEGDAAAGGEGTASAEAVTACQGDLDALMADKVIKFNSGSAYMPDSSLAVVDEVAAAIKDCDGMSIAVGGHTDATGSAEVNQILSQARADAVSAALTERGIAAERITATGFGSTKPKVEGASASAENRRIEFTVNAGSSTSEGGE